MSTERAQQGKETLTEAIQKVSPAIAIAFFEAINNVLNPGQQNTLFIKIDDIKYVAPEVRALALKNVYYQDGLRESLKEVGLDPAQRAIVLNSLTGLEDIVVNPNKNSD